MNLSEILCKGNTAVITGASSGIGRAACVKCAKFGMNVWMLDIDAEDLSLAVALVKSKSTADQLIQDVICDVSSETSMKNIAEQVFSHQMTTSVNFLMNNAAVQTGGGPLTTPMETFMNTFSVNTLGPIYGCQAFIPKMQEKNLPGLIINTGSKQGITAPPGNLTYNVSKSALKCWTEGLEHELRQGRKDGGQLHSALLIPGWVNTSIYLKQVKAEAKLKGEVFDKESVFFHEDKPAEGAWMPMQVVDFMLAELEKNRFYIVCPDNDVDRETDNLRMTWAMQDITKDRPPLSRWHPEWKDKFIQYLKDNKK